jgi:hypothetical protein
MTDFNEQTDTDVLQAPHEYCECQTVHMFPGWEAPHCACHRAFDDPIHKESA